MAEETRKVPAKRMNKFDRYGFSFFPIGQEALWRGVVLCFALRDTRLYRGRLGAARAPPLIDLGATWKAKRPLF